VAGRLAGARAPRTQPRDSACSPVRLLAWLQNIAAAARKTGKKVKVLLRINPDVDPEARRRSGGGGFQ
jgi:hypothetical protein